MTPVKRTASEGDCVASIAYEHGFFADTVWEHEANSELREERTDPNQLVPGDVVHVPELTVRNETKDAEKRHRFRRRGVPERLHLQLKLADEPRAHLAYTIEIEGHHTEGKTDAEGRIEHWIPPNAKRGRLIISESEQYALSLGTIPPIDQDSGVRRRLWNLGFLESARPDDEEVASAIRAFQSRYGLTPSGEADDETRATLVEEHGA